MQRAIEAAAAGAWPSGDAIDMAVLTYEDRTRRRCRLTTVAGVAFLLDLPDATVLTDGAGLKTETGDWIGVKAAAEHLIEVRAADAHTLARLAWHLGNRHLPAEILPDAILIRPDHVIEAMLEANGGQVRNVDRPFNPEGGAYGGFAGHRHGGSHGHGHNHGHNHDDGHSHD